MRIDLRRYLYEDTVILNMADTWPKEWVELLDKNKRLIRNYKYMQTRNNTLQSKAYSYHPYKTEYLNRKNKYYDAYEALKIEFGNLIRKFNKTFLCYHASRYMREEIEDIIANGLNVSTQKSVRYRLNNLLGNDYISLVECKSLYENNLLQTQVTRNNLLYFTLGNVDVSYPNSYDLFNLYNNFGGEIIYETIEGTELAKRLNSSSVPCLVIAGIKSDMVDDFNLHKIVDNIFRLYCKKYTSKISAEIYVSNNITDIRSIITVDNKTKLSKK